MIYLAFIFWMFALVCLSRGIVHMWINMVGAKAVGFVLLPGTVISELSYYLACLLSGAEFKPRKLVENESGEKADGPPAKSKTKAAPPNPLDSGGAPYITPVLTSLMPLLASMALIWLIYQELGHASVGTTASMALTVKLPPIAGNTLWSMLTNQVEIMKHTWSVVAGAFIKSSDSRLSDLLMHYLVICMVLRMAPMRLTLKQAMFGMMLFTMAASLIVAINTSDGRLFSKFWPLLTFTWGLAMLMLLLTLTVRGVMALSREFMD